MVYAIVALSSTSCMNYRIGSCALPATMNIEISKSTRNWSAKNTSASLRPIKGCYGGVMFFLLGVIIGVFWLLYIKPRI